MYLLFKIKINKSKSTSYDASWYKCRSLLMLRLQSVDGTDVWSKISREAKINLPKMINYPTTLLILFQSTVPTWSCCCSSYMFGIQRILWHVTNTAKLFYWWVLKRMLLEINQTRPQATTHYVITSWHHDIITYCQCVTKGHKVNVLRYGAIWT